MGAISPLLPLSSQEAPSFKLRISQRAATISKSAAQSLTLLTQSFKPHYFKFPSIRLLVGSIWLGAIGGLSALLLDFVWLPLTLGLGLIALILFHEQLRRSMRNQEAWDKLSEIRTTTQATRLDAPQWDGIETTMKLLLQKKNNPYQHLHEGCLSEVETAFKKNTQAPFTPEKKEAFIRALEQAMRAIQPSQPIPPLDFTPEDFESL